MGSRVFQFSRQLGSWDEEEGVSRSLRTASTPQTYALLSSASMWYSLSPAGNTCERCSASPSCPDPLGHTWDGADRGSPSVSCVPSTGPSWAPQQEQPEP